MISKTLGQLTQDETRLWEMVFCIEIPNFGIGASEADSTIAAKLADTAIAALRQYRAESEAKPVTDPRDPPHEEGSGIIGTYDTLNKGWWINGPTIPRFEPEGWWINGPTIPRFEPDPRFITEEQTP